MYRPTLVGIINCIRFSYLLFTSENTLVTALQARTFAVWTLTSAVIRVYAAYNINNKMCVTRISRDPLLTPVIVFSMYDMAMLSYLIAFGHFSSELLIFRSCKINPGVLSPVIVSSKC